MFTVSRIVPSSLEERIVNLKVSSYYTTVRMKLCCTSFEPIRWLAYLFLAVLFEQGGDELVGRAGEAHEGGKPHHVAVDKTNQVVEWPSSRGKGESIPLVSCDDVLKFAN